MLFLDNLTIILLHYQLLTASISESSVENIVVTASVLFRSKLETRCKSKFHSKLMSYLVNFKHENRVKLSRVFDEIKSLKLLKSRLMNY